MLPAPRSIESSSPPGIRPSSARLLWDHQNCLPLGKHLSYGDLIVLISPVVAPLYHGPNSTSDPFEPFGRALAERHPWVRHITYTRRAGITGTHVAFIKRARAVIFVISGPPGPNEPSQAELAEVARLAGKPRPQIVLACCNIQTNYTGRVPFPTLVKTRDYSPHELRTAAGIILGDEDLNRPISLPPIMVEPPKAWRVEDWTAADMPATYDLWCRSVPAKFHISQSLLASILNRDGWSRHYVVRNPMDRQILGFCATYTTYADAGEERLIGSLALILVNDAHRRRGIGRSLHDQALANLQRTRGVSRLQLGTTFPRLFYGPPAEMTNSLAWFKRRGWTVDQPVPGKGQEVSDWVVRFEDLPQEGHISMAGLTFRSCDFSEYPTVLGIVERECARKDLRGWYDPYGVLRNTMNIRDIIVGLEGQTVVAAALIYSSNSDAPIKYELPWASVLGKDVGGVSCIFIADDHPDMVNSRDSVMVRLLFSCARFLSEQGMRRMFVDGVKGGEEGFQVLGFKKWATYRDIWRNI